MWENETVGLGDEFVSLLSLEFGVWSLSFVEAALAGQHRKVTQQHPFL